MVSPIIRIGFRLGDGQWPLFSQTRIQFIFGRSLDAIMLLLRLATFRRRLRFSAFFSSSQINITHILSLACHVSVTMGGSALHMNPVPWIVPESSSYWLRHSPVDPSGISVCIVIVFDVRFQAQIVSEG